jgi:hypothetical protein
MDRAIVALLSVVSWLASLGIGYGWALALTPSRCGTHPGVCACCRMIFTSNCWCLYSTGTE